MQPALYIYTTKMSCNQLLLYCYVQHAQVNSLIMINIIALSLYNVKLHACLSTLTLPEGTLYLVLPLHLPHVTKYIYIIINIPHLVLAYSTEQFRLT